MSNKSSKKARSSAQILAEIAALPPSVQGTISSYKNVRKNGTAAIYYNLQYTHKGKNHSFAIPVDKVEDFKAAISTTPWSTSSRSWWGWASRRTRKSREIPCVRSCANSKRCSFPVCFSCWPGNGSPVRRRGIRPSAKNSIISPSMRTGA